ncbi:hypothetical protein [Brevundimonas sp.]|uniref:hypothetical protein n=1 Tax=Brevundimonas sp. TaxID=1871086 RepID=UPI003AF8D163
MTQPRRDFRSRTISVFALVGPAVGTLITIAILLGADIRHDAEWTNWGWMGVVSAAAAVVMYFPFGIVLGAIPGAVTGTIMAKLSRYLGSAAAWLATASITGACVSILSYLAAPFIHMRPFTAMDYAGLAFVGLCAGAVSAWATRNHRPLPTGSVSTSHPASNG